MRPNFSSHGVLKFPDELLMTAIAENSAAITYENAKVTWFVLDVFGILLPFRV